jgi:hypothetical protein
MIKDPDFYTVTMARVYADQGYWEKAAEIYRHLLKLEPARRDLAAALAEVEKKIDEAGSKKPEDLIPLFREWLNLVFQYKHLRGLRKLKRQI